MEDEPQRRKPENIVLSTFRKARERIASAIQSFVSIREARQTLLNGKIHPNDQGLNIFQDVERRNDVIRIK